MILKEFGSWPKVKVITKKCEKCVRVFTATPKRTEEQKGISWDIVDGKIMCYRCAGLVS